DVTNTGGREGAEVAEVYVGELKPSVPRPPKELKAFARVKLDPGARQRVKVTLNGRAFSYYDTKAYEWRVDPGAFMVFVGDSEAHIQLKGAMALTASQAAAGASR